MNICQGKVGNTSYKKVTTVSQASTHSRASTHVPNFKEFRIVLNCIQIILLSRISTHAGRNSESAQNNDYYKFNSHNTALGRCKLKSHYMHAYMVTSVTLKLREVYPSEFQFKCMHVLDYVCHSVCLRLH